MENNHKRCDLKSEDWPYYSPEEKKRIMDHTAEYYDKVVKGSSYQEDIDLDDKLSRQIKTKPFVIKSDKVKATVEAVAKKYAPALKELADN